MTTMHEFRITFRTSTLKPYMTKIVSAPTVSEALMQCIPYWSVRSISMRCEGWTRTHEQCQAWTTAGACRNHPRATSMPEGHRMYEAAPQIIGRAMAIARGME